MTNNSLENLDSLLDEITSNNDLLREAFEESKKKKRLKYGILLAAVVGVVALAIGGGQDKMYSMIGRISEIIDGEKGKGSGGSKSSTSSSEKCPSVTFESYFNGKQEDTFNEIFKGAMPYVFFCANDFKLHGDKDVSHANYFKKERAGCFSPNVFTEFYLNYELNDKMDDAYMYDKTDVGFAYFNCSQAYPGTGGKSLYEKLKIQSDISPQIGVFAPWLGGFEPRDKVIQGK